MLLIFVDASLSIGRLHTDPTFSRILKLTIAIGHTQEREQTITIYIMSVPSYMVKTQMIVFGNKGLIGLVQLFVLSSRLVS